MEIKNTYYNDLITRYFYGEATPDDIVELEHWVKADPANATLFNEFQKTWKTVEQIRIGSSVDIDLEWNHLASKLGNGKYEPKRSQTGMTVTHPSMTEDQSKIVHGSAELRFAPVRTSKIISYALRIAAVSLLLLIPAFFLYQNFNRPTEQHLASGKEISVHTLPDGTRVTLYANATLTYPSRFDGPFRKVALKGEGWFEVAHNKKQPFIIAAGNVRVRVVGTSFSVNTQTVQDTKEIILTSGMVRVYYENNPQKMALLLPGEKAELSGKGEEITKTANEDVNFLAWKTRHLVFNNTPLSEVADVLTKVYLTRIRVYDDQIKDCRITATFDKQSLESVLNVLKATLDLRVHYNGAGFDLYGNGCRQGQ